MSTQKIISKDQLLILFQNTYGLMKELSFEIQAVRLRKKSEQTIPLLFGQVLIEAYQLSLPQDRVVSMMPTKYDEEILNYLAGLNDPIAGIFIKVESGVITVSDLTWDNLKKNPESLESRMKLRLKAERKKIVASLSGLPFGDKFAQEVASKLMKTDYCHISGMGGGCDGFSIDKNKKEFFYASFFEGEIFSILKSFPDEKKFVEWLSKQSDRSMAKYAKGLEEGTSYICKSLLELWLKDYPDRK